MIKKNFLCLSIALSCITNASLVKLRPPNLNPQGMVHSFCDRPKRLSGITIFLQQLINKTIIHCYGHGGSGYTTLFGSIQESLKLFLATNPDKLTPIHIIGTGCMGLVTAIELHRLGFANIKISTKEIYDIPSWRAGGFFEPGTGKETAPKDILHLELGLLTYEILYQIEQGNHPYISKNVVQKMPLYCHKDIYCGVEVLPPLGLMPASRPVTLDFGNNVHHENYIEHFTYFINITELMKQLWAKIAELHIPVIQQEITDFKQCPETVIFNCAGSGSGALNNNDPDTFKSRGYFFMLAPSDKELPYMLFTKVLQDGKKECIYLFPKPMFISSADRQGTLHEGILGGTFIAHAEKLSEHEQQALALQEHKKLAQRAQEFFYGKM